MSLIEHDFVAASIAEQTLARAREEAARDRQALEARRAAPAAGAQPVEPARVPAAEQLGRADAT